MEKGALWACVAVNGNYFFTSHWDLMHLFLIRLCMCLVALLQQHT